MYQTLKIFLCFETDGTIDSGLIIPQHLLCKVMDNPLESALYALCLNAFKGHQLFLGEEPVWPVHLLIYLFEIL